MPHAPMSQATGGAYNRCSYIGSNSMTVLGAPACAPASIPVLTILFKYSGESECRNALGPAVRCPH